MRSLRFLPLLLALHALPAGAAAQIPAVPELLLRVDDIGMNHAVNMAVEQLAGTGMPFSVSVMFANPWYQEAVEILKRNPQISVGVHLTLNSEWKNYRWGPVLGKEAVPTLVDSVGYFHPSTAEFLAQPYDLGEVERELSAQVERALRSGLKIDYVDHHMGTAAATPQLRAVVERIAKRYGVGISRYFGEVYHTLFAVPIEEKKQEFLTYIAGLKPGAPHLSVIHVARATPEMNVLVDQNNAAQNTAAGEPLVARHRQAELETLLSPEFARQVQEGKVRLITYADLIARQGLNFMKRPQ
ncbi:MAG TPA: ChbG/HpnK family deacetylase [Chloroflexota bacterium]|nr:ChbG/HpnK family deacetylase [Chloroflexota bacterium]